MSLKPLPIGIDNFEKMIAGDYYYADKTWLIKELWDYKGFEGTPRRKDFTPLFLALEQGGLTNIRTYGICFWKEEAVVRRGEAT